MRALLDTCVVSELNRPKGNARVKERVAALERSDVFLSVITVGEIAKGIALAKPGKQRTRYEVFLLELEQSYGNRLLEIDIETAHIWGDVTAQAKQQGITVPASDGLIAATAIRHGLRVVTRDVSHFEGTGAMLLNPWEDA